MEEIWKDIEGYEGKYQVSNTEKVRSLNYNNTGIIRELKPKINRFGYLEVTLSKNNKTRGFLISTLVGKAFLENKNPDKFVIHIGDSKDNYVKNLKYGYRSEFLFLTYKKGKRKGKASSNFVSYKGVKANKITDIARMYHQNPKIVYKRLKNGWTLEEALEIPKLSNKIKTNVVLYKYKDELISIKEIAKRLNTSTKTIYKRFYRGWSIDEVMEIPIKQRRSI